MLEAQPTQRVWICVTSALLAVIILVWTAPDYPLRPHGIVLPVAKTKSPLEIKDVVFYPYPPLEYQRIGRINIVLHYSPDMKNVQKDIVNYARFLAARVGANGVILTGWGASSDSVPMQQAIYEIQGWAIDTPNRPFDFDRGENKNDN